MEGTISLGGVWADWNARVEAAEARASAAEESEHEQRILSLKISAEREALLSDFASLTQSLTATQLQDKNNKQILEILGNEKLSLEQRTAGLESARHHQDAILTTLRERVVALEIDVAKRADREEELIAQLHSTHQSLDVASATLVRTEGVVDALRRTVAARDTQIETLQHNVETKSRQLVVLCKERDRLRTENDALKKGCTRPKQPVQTSNKENVAAAVTVTPTKESPCPSSISPATPDPLSWLLDGDTSQSSPSPEKERAVRASIGIMLNKISTITGRERKVAYKNVSANSPN